MVTAKGERSMKDRKPAEQELLADLGEMAAHADVLAQQLPQELDPLERLRGTVTRYDRPLDGCWDEDIDPDEEERCSDGSRRDRERPTSER